MSAVDFKDLEKSDLRVDRVYKGTPKPTGTIEYE